MTLDGSCCCFIAQADYAAARTELDSVTTLLRKDIAAFEAARGEPFLYQGRRLADVLAADAQQQQGGSPRGVY